jgi:hypothetical protein
VGIRSQEYEEIASSILANKTQLGINPVGGELFIINKLDYTIQQLTSQIKS